MTYGDFYDIAKYGNENWKGFFTPKEVAENAYEYLCAFEESIKKKELTKTIQELLNLLLDEQSEESLYYANLIWENIESHMNYEKRY